MNLVYDIRSMQQLANIFHRPHNNNGIRQSINYPEKSLTLLFAKKYLAEIEAVVATI